MTVWCTIFLDDSKKEGPNFKGYKTHKVAQVGNKSWHPTFDLILGEEQEQNKTLGILR